MVSPVSGLNDALARLGRWPTPLAPELREPVAAEQLRMIWLHSEIALLIASGFAVVLAQRLQGEVAPSWAHLWLLLKLAWAALRFVAGRRYTRQMAAGRPALSWRWPTEGMLAVDGAVWGLAGAVLVAGQVSVASLTAAALACVSCVATFGLQVSLRATAAYVVPILLPTAAGLMVRGDDAGVLGGIGLLLLLVVLLSTATRGQRRVAEQVRDRLRAQALVVEKDQALQLALQQSAVKSQFLGSVSHELRTPLHGILGLSRLLHLESSDALARQRLELVEASARHLLGLINDLLDVSRIDSGQFSLRVEVVDLGRQIAQVVAVHEVRAHDKGLSLSLDLDLPAPCWVRADAARLRQVIDNLLGNAIKFTQQGRVSVRVRRAADDVCRIEVEDTGVGIEAEDLTRIFDAFEQADSAPFLPLEGAGLGLKIAREIAAAMAGELTVSSQPGVGSRFVFSARLASADPPPAPSLWPAGPVLPGARRRPQVLLAEDDELNAMIAIAFLERADAVVERVHDGKQAVRRALRETQRPDLLLMDCRMPVMDGYQATREIRQQEAILGLPRLPVIALTATVTELGREQCLAAGMDDFLAKPFTLEDLLRVLPQFGQRG